MRQLVNNVITHSPAMLPALHRTLDELACRGRPGITMMREILAENPLGTTVTASGLESRVLRIAQNAGIRELKRQVDVGGHSWLGRVDFAIVRLRLLIEVDSVVHHSSPMDVARDRARDEAMLDVGWARCFASGRRTSGATRGSWSNSYAAPFGSSKPFWVRRPAIDGRVLSRDVPDS
ncbi:MAG: hypothetical protein JWN29_1285 [Acidimicrobiales bacterium]|nr:hypothetical protein [Acidimicrobiales bacterium]